MTNRQASIIRTERGLTIKGTRITLYDVMDCVTAQYPPKFIQGLFELTAEQIDAARILLGSIASQGWFDFVPIRFVIFEEVGFSFRQDWWASTN